MVGNCTRKVSVCGKCGFIRNICNFAPFARYGKSVNGNRSRGCLRRAVICHFFKHAHRCTCYIFFGDFKTARYGFFVLFICTVLGSFNYYVIIARVCRQYNIFAVFLIFYRKSVRNICIRNCKAFYKTVIFICLRQFIYCNCCFFEIYPNCGNRCVCRNINCITCGILCSVYTPRFKFFACRRSKCTFGKFIFARCYRNICHFASAAVCVK